jgi:hypothetical protein
MKVVIRTKGFVEKNKIKSTSAGMERVFPHHSSSPFLLKTLKDVKTNRMHGFTSTKINIYKMRSTILLVKLVV